MSALIRIVVCVACFAMQPLLAEPCREVETDVWLKQYNACPDSDVAFYNAVVQLLNSGEADAAKQLLTDSAYRHRRFSPLRKLQRELKQASNSDAYQRVAQLANQRLKAWLEKEYARNPQYKEKPSHLEKGEFEKRQAFLERREAYTKEWKAWTQALGQRAQRVRKNIYRRP